MDERDLITRLREGPVLVGDGAWGTLLLERGLPGGEPPETMTARDPDAITDIARLYLAAGADLVTTNTFGASPVRLATSGLESSFEAMNRGAVLLAREVADAWPRPAWVLGSMGPTGRILAPLGDLHSADAEDAFRRQAAVLAAAGVDAILVETMSDLAEAGLATAAARREAPGLPVIVTCTFDPTPRGFFTLMGDSVSEVTAVLLDVGADAVGANCGHGMAIHVGLARALRACTRAPLVIQPNAGLPRVGRAGAEYPETPEDFAHGAAALSAMGVAMVGGCCGTRPAHLRAVRDAVDARVLAPAH